jgi:hypothetical protein
VARFAVNGRQFLCYTSAVSTASEWKAILNKAHMTVVYPLTTPVATPLTEAQLQALKPMRTPLTTDGRITTNGTHPGLAVEYYEQLTHAFAANS